MKNKKNPVAVICSSLGTVLLIVIILICLPLTVPKAMGYQVYSVVSGSMEPSIPTGSLVYITETAPSEVQEGDVIAFYGGADASSVITHRVVENRTFMGEFVTKGDANEDADMNPIPYSQFIGSVSLSIPVLGAVAEILTGTAGKAAAVSVIGLALVLQLAASLLAKKKS